MHCAIRGTRAPNALHNSPAKTKAGTDGLPIGGLPIPPLLRLHAGHEPRRPLRRVGPDQAHPYEVDQLATGPVVVPMRGQGGLELEAHGLFCPGLLVS
jgi:hypothetical protein